jgi:CO/xanthine dehydrogenase FAD-binding subunit
LHVFDYYQPSSLNEALTFLSKSPDTTKLLAGGTDLIIQIREKFVDPDYIIDLTNVHELKGIIKKDDKLIIGSMVTFDELEHNHLINEYVPILAQAAASVGSPQIRNTATIGGNIANAAAAADSLPVLLALEAKVCLQSIDALKEVSIEDILVGINKTKIKPDEILTHIVIPIPHKNTKMAFAKLGRRKALAIARINLGMTLKMLDDGKIEKATIALGAVGEHAYRVHQVETFLNQKALNEKTIEDACTLINEVVAARLGARSTATYKKSISKAVLSKAFKTFEEEIGGECK